MNRRERCPRYPDARSRVVRRFLAAWTPRFTLAIFYSPLLQTEHALGGHGYSLLTCCIIAQATSHT